MHKLALLSLLFSFVINNCMELEKEQLVQALTKTQKRRLQRKKAFKNKQSSLAQTALTKFPLDKNKNWDIDDDYEAIIKSLESKIDRTTEASIKTIGDLQERVFQLENNLISIIDRTQQTTMQTMGDLLRRTLPVKNNSNIMWYIEKGALVAGLALTAYNTYKIYRAISRSPESVALILANDTTNARNIKKLQEDVQQLRDTLYPSPSSQRMARLHPLTSLEMLPFTNANARFDKFCTLF